MPIAHKSTTRHFHTFRILQKVEICNFKRHQNQNMRIEISVHLTKESIKLGRKIHIVRGNMTKRSVRVDKAKRA